jgi:hypothetical protein
MTIMQALSRRTFLKRAPVAAVAIGVPSIAVAVEVKSTPAETPEEAIARLTQELLSALKQSAEWHKWTDWLENPDPKAGVFQLIARRKTVAYSGAGYYAVWNGNREKAFWIERDPAKDHATMGRCYRMTPSDKADGPIWMFDDHLQSMLIEKIGGVA